MSSVAARSPTHSVRAHGCTCHDTAYITMHSLPILDGLLANRCYTQAALASIQKWQSLQSTLVSLRTHETAAAVYIAINRQPMATVLYRSVSIRFTKSLQTKNVATHIHHDAFPRGPHPIHNLFRKGVPRERCIDHDIAYHDTSIYKTSLF